MIEHSDANRRIRWILVLIVLVLPLIGTGFVRFGLPGGSSAGAATQTTRRPAVTVPVTSGGPLSPYVGTGIPVFPTGFNPLIPDVGPSATSRPKVVDGKVTRRVSAASVAELVTALQNATPGTVVELADGEYEGQIDVSAVGTAAAPIVITSKRPLGAVFTRESKFRLLGNYVTVDRLKFVKTASRVIEVGGLGNRVTRSVFEECGDGNGGATTGLVFLDNPAAEGTSDPDGMARPQVDRKAVFDSNVFIRPRNTVFWQNHGLRGNSYVGNRIQGPHGINDGETEAIKIGFGFGAEDTNTTIAYNEISGWEGWPYVIGIKSSSVTITGNVLGSGRIEVRYGDRVTVSKNVILNGDLMLSGSGHTVTGNVVVSSVARDGLGPLVVVATGSLSNEYGNFNGTDLPYYYRALADSTIADNTFVSLDRTDAGTAFLLGLNDNVWSAPPKGNKFRRNLFFRASGPETFVGAAGTPAPPEGLLASLNDWNSNVFMCGSTCTGAEVKVPGILGLGGNVAGDARRGLLVSAGANPRAMMAATTRPVTTRAAQKTPPTTAGRSTTKLAVLPTTRKK